MKKGIAYLLLLMMLFMVRLRPKAAGARDNGSAS